MRTKLIKAVNEHNEVTFNIKERQEQTKDKRKEVNELMVKCRLISEEDIQEQSEEVDSTLNDLPEEIMIEQDKLIGKINALSKGSKRHKYKHQNKSMIFRSYENY